jgi:hypothetical protein
VDLLRHTRGAEQHSQRCDSDRLPVLLTVLWSLQDLRELA